MLLLTKSKGYMSNVHYSGFPKHLQTKSNLHISISQSKLKHKYFPLDTLYVYYQKLDLSVDLEGRYTGYENTPLETVSPKNVLPLLRWRESVQSQQSHWRPIT